ncbi:leucine-rich repeat-containing protein 46 [Manacus vitellinus]|uniref:leucine-rich repeat-containing protein 46 n=1 Tax=Manacus vitellinus TaxID=328815 RepID=UPI00115F412E|nr:leucine-rich repeat-containing protein 46 [Manacus vitellinus]
MSEQEEKTLCGDREGTSPGVTLSDSLVLTRSRSTELLPSSTIRLDRENISCIGKLRDQGGIHSLYLQQNKIERIENLGCFPNLRFLCLAGNRIQRVENLQALPHLCALDLSHNLIQVLDTEELPRSLQILDLTGNECTRQQGYRWPGTPLRGSRGSQRAPGGVQSRSKALEKETGAKGTGNRQLSQISCSGRE